MVHGSWFRLQFSRHDIKNGRRFKLEAVGVSTTITVCKTTRFVVCFGLGIYNTEYKADWLKLLGDFYTKREYNHSG